MSKPEIDSCCELGVKGSCITCDFTTYCNGKWSRGVGQSAGAETNW